MAYTVKELAQISGISMLMDTVSLGVKAKEACDLLFKRAKIATLPMNGWGGAITTRYLRLVFTNESKERLKGIGAKVRTALCLK